MSNDSDVDMKRFLSYIFVITAVIILVNPFNTLGQSTSNWRYKGGNASGTKYQPVKSKQQSLDKFEVKWSTPLISGDVSPLIGNLVDNKQVVSDTAYYPNEIVAFVGDTLFIIDGFANVRAKRSLYDNFKWLDEVTCLINPQQTDMTKKTSGKVVVGISSLEYQTAAQDSIVTGFIVGYDDELDSVRLMSRLAVDISEFGPNTYAKVTPVGGQVINDELTFFATVNMSHPTVESYYNSQTDPQPYFRGMAYFPATKGYDVYPFRDIGDDHDKRIFYAGDVTQGDCSFKNASNGELNVLLPNKPTPELGAVNIESGINTDTYAHIPYSSAITYVSGEPESMYSLGDIDMSAYVDATGIPYIHSYFVDIIDANIADSGFVLVTEEYSGRNGSVGTPKIYLFDNDGFPLATQSNADSQPFQGTANHGWSVAVGDIDGKASNSFDYYPNNSGKEIVVTQSTKDHDVAGNTLSILKYNSGERLEKPDGSGKKLFYLDTICTHKINGWVAAVNDIDGKDNGKDEIILVDGSRVMVLTMRNYSSDLFRGGSPFDTVLVKEFPYQTISYLSVADIDGDNKNDIIVTTHDSTYVFGNIIPYTLRVTEPSSDLETLCLGDSLYVEWENAIPGQDFVDIFLLPYENGVPVPSEMITLIEDYPNHGSLEFYNHHIEENLIGLTGRVIVQSVSKPLSQVDTSGYVRFMHPSVWPLTTWETVEELGKPYTFIGQTSCNDSLTIQYMDIDSTWVSWDTFVADIQDDYSFYHTIDLPCVTFFNCKGKDTLDHVLDFRYILHSSVFHDTLGYFKMQVKPYHLPIVWEKSEYADPSIIFTWDYMDIDMPCDTVTFSYSIDEGETFIGGKEIDITENKYKWLVPKTGPIEVLTRFCCKNSCVRTDTIMAPWLPQYINIVAPNPFEPYRQKAQIVYQVPKNTKVDIMIFDQNNRMVAHPVKEKYRRANIMYTDTWDGIREFDNSPCAVGMYYIIFQIEDGQKEIHPIFIKS